MGRLCGKGFPAHFGVLCVCVSITRKRGSSLGRDAHLNVADRRVVMDQCDVRHRAEVGAGACEDSGFAAAERLGSLAVVCQ